MTKPATKRAPASQSLAAHATKGPNRTPKGSGPRVAPSLEDRVLDPVVTVDADAEYMRRGFDVSEAKRKTREVIAALRAPLEEE